MVSKKQRNILVVGIWIIIFFSVVSIYLITQAKKHTPLQGIWSEIQTHIPEHPYIRMQAFLTWNTRTLQEIDSQADISIDENLLSGSDIKNLWSLTGKIDMQSKRTVDHAYPYNSLFSFDIQWSMWSWTTFSGSIAGRFVDNTYYLMIEELNVSYDRNNPNFLLWHNLVNTYINKRVGFTSNELHTIVGQYFHPLLKRNTIIYDTMEASFASYNTWVAYKLYWWALLLSWTQWSQDKHIWSFISSWSKLTWSFSAKGPDIYDVHIQQNNAYQWVFSGSVRYDIGKKRWHQYRSGNIVRPQWLRIENIYHVISLRTFLKTWPVNRAPRQFIPWKTIQKNILWNTRENE